MSTDPEAVADYTPNVAIVTGAAKGIGREIALRLADDGFDVAVNDIPAQLENLQEVAKLIKGKGKKAFAVAGDVSVEEDVEKLVAETVRELGSVDVMVANAGVGGGGSILAIDMEKFDRVVAVNLRGVMLCYKHAAVQMVKQKRGGRLISASSVLGKRSGKFVAPYSATKFGVRGITQSAAHELAPYKITVNSYAPGLILTEMTSHVRDVEFGGKHGSYIKSLWGATPSSPDAGPEVVASMVSYLCKPEAYFITGESLSVDGGLSL